MKFARIGLVFVALVAAIGAAVLANMMLSSEPQVVEKVEPLETIKVLIAAKDIGVGSTVGAGALEWQDWPKSAASDRFVTKRGGSDALADYQGATARSTIVAGEPILGGKLVKMGEGGFMSAILPTGLRAISVKISPESGAGGFILPNDRVDVILTRRERARGGGNDNFVSEAILTNVRVLAIDQALRGEKNDGASKESQVAIGKTATLALRPLEAEQLAQAESTGVISLALRSMADSDPAQNADDNLADFRGSGSMTVIRYGISSTVSARR
jgi:pilus assembly protein CpaB